MALRQLVLQKARVLQKQLLNNLYVLRPQNKEHLRTLLAEHDRHHILRLRAQPAVLVLQMRSAVLGVIAPQEKPAAAAARS